MGRQPDGSLKGVDEALFTAELRALVLKRLYERGIPQLRLAEYIDVNQTYLCSWLKGNLTCTPAFLEKVAEGVGLQITFQEFGPFPDLGGRKAPHMVCQADEVTRLIEQDIANGVWKPGDKLPTVLAMAVRYETTHPHVCEALKRLRAKGLIRSKAGGGNSGSWVLLPE